MVIFISVHVFLFPVNLGCDDRVGRFLEVNIINMIHTSNKPGLYFIITLDFTPEFTLLNNII